jgi:hypothetical protein
MILFRLQIWTYRLYDEAGPFLRMPAIDEDIATSRSELTDDNLLLAP